MNADVRKLFDEHYSAGQRVTEILVEHSQAVAALSVEIARACDGNWEFIEEAAWLHDIGIRYTHAPGIDCHGEQHYLWHGVIGREICEKAGFPRHALVCERHVGTGLTVQEIRSLDIGLPERDMLPLSQAEQIVCYADKYFSKSSSERLPLVEIRRRLARHGVDSLARFERLHERFGSLLRTRR